MSLRRRSKLFAGLGLFGSLWTTCTVLAQTPQTPPTAADAAQAAKPAAKHGKPAHTKTAKPEAPTPTGKAIEPRTKPAASAVAAEPKAAAPATKTAAAAPGQPPVLVTQRAATTPITPSVPPNVAVASAAPPPQPPAAYKPPCTLAEAEQPRGGRLDVLGDNFGASPVVRIAGRPARMIERRPDRIAVQVPPDSNGGAITLLHDGHASSCGTLVIIGKDR